MWPLHLGWRTNGGYHGGRDDSIISEENILRNKDWKTNGGYHGRHDESTMVETVEVAHHQQQVWGLLHWEEPEKMDVFVIVFVIVFVTIFGIVF